MTMLIGTNSLEVDFDSTEELRAYVTGVDCWRGYRSLDGRIAPGELVAQLINRDGRFSPENGAGPYAGDIAPGKAVRFERNGTPVWAGYLESISPHMYGRGIGAVPGAELRAIGALGYYGQRVVYPLASTGGEPISTLLHNTLDAAGYLPIARFAGADGVADQSTVSFSIAVPPDVEDGDTLVLAMWRSSLDLLFTTSNGPTDMGWTAQENGNSGTNFYGRLYSKVASSEPASYTFVFSNTSARVGWTMVVIKGAASIADTSVQVNSASTTLTSAAVTTARNNSLVLGLYGQIGTTSAALSPPSGMSERLDIDVGTPTGANIMVATGVQNVAGSSGAKNGTSGTSAISINFLVALNPSTAAAAGRVFEDGKFAAGRWGGGGRRALDILQELVDTEGGYLYENASGAIVYEGSEHRLGSPHQTSQATYSDAVAATHGYLNLRRLDPRALLRKSVSAYAASYSTTSLETLWQAPSPSYSLPAGAQIQFVAEYPGPADVTGEFVELWVPPVVGSDVTQTGGSNSDLIVQSVQRTANRMRFVVHNNHVSTPMILTLVRARGYRVQATSQREIAVAELAGAAQEELRAYRYDVPGPYLQSLADAQTRAEMEVTKYGVERPAYELEYYSTSNSLARQVSDRITLVAEGLLTEMAVDADFYVEGIGHHVEFDSFEDRVTFLLSSAGMVDDLS